MKVNIQVQCGRSVGPTKPLDQRYHASAGCLFRMACLLDQMHGDDAVNDTQHMVCDQRTAGEEKTQLATK